MSYPSANSDLEATPLKASARPSQAPMTVGELLYMHFMVGGWYMDANVVLRFARRITPYLRLCMGFMAVFFFAFYLEATIPKTRYPFVTKPTQGDWTTYGCETVAKDWTFLSLEADFSAFAITCHSVYFRSQLCQDIRPHLNEGSQAALLPPLAVQMRTGLADTKVFCVPHLFNAKDPFNYLPVVTDPMAVMDAPTGLFEFHYALPSGDKIYKNGQTYSTPQRGLRSIDVTVKTLVSSKTPSVAWKVLYQEHETNVDGPHPWVEYENWRLPRGGEGLEIIARIAAAFGLVQGLWDLVEIHYSALPSKVMYLVLFCFETAYYLYCYVDVTYSSRIYTVGNTLYVWAFISVVCIMEGARFFMRGPFAKAERTAQIEDHKRRYNLN